MQIDTLIVNELFRIKVGFDHITQTFVVKQKQEADFHLPTTATEKLATCLAEKEAVIKHEGNKYTLYTRDQSKVLVKKALATVRGGPGVGPRTSSSAAVPPSGANVLPSSKPLARPISPSLKPSKPTSPSNQLLGIPSI